MDLFLKKAALPSVEDFAIDVAVKRNLTSELGRSIRSLQEGNIEKSVITDNEYSNNLCYVIEAILIHGLKDKFTTRSLSFFGNSQKIPEPQFWSAVSSFCHQNVIVEIRHLNQICSDIGRGRAWLRLSLNDGLTISYISTMLTDISTLSKYYNSNAYIRDAEQSDIMKSLLEGLGVFKFDLYFNDSTLNVWNSVPLTLSNLWTPPLTPQPVMPALDVMAFFDDPKNQNPVSSQTNIPEQTKRSKNEHEVEIKTQLDSVESFSENMPPEKNICESVPNEPIDRDTNIEPDTTIKGSEEVDANPSTDTIPEVHIEMLKEPKTPESEETSSKISSSDSVPDFGLEVIENFPDLIQIGNKLQQDTGWSSSFDPDQHTDPDQSYDSLLQSYNKNLSKIVIGTPEIAGTFSSAMGKRIDEDCDNDTSSDTKSPEFDFEIVPRYFAAEHADLETKELMSILGKICSEQGLNNQKFQCNACGRSVGLIYGKARLCSYDGYSYCYECHDNEEEFIPARMIHNWDFKQYPVSKKAKSFLQRIIKDPLLDIKKLNPLLYTAIEEMAQMQLLRTQLTFLRSYIFTCKQSVAEELRMRLWPREYLYEHVHLYSLDDLLEVPSGVLAQALQKVITFAKKHVAGCQLCLLKGFICEVCDNPKPIYPFDVETTYHCDQCLAVYHATCMDRNKYCKKCIRKMRRQQMMESSTPE